MKKTIVVLTNCLVCIALVFSFFLFLGEDVMAEDGTFTGVLNTTEAGYSVTEESGKIIEFTYTTDLSTYIGKTVKVSYTGTLQSFTITGIALSSGESIVTGGGNTLPNTYIFSFSKILIGLFFLISAIAIYQTRYVDVLRNLDKKESFEEKVIKKCL